MIHNISYKISTNVIVTYQVTSVLSVFKGDCSNMPCLDVHVYILASNNFTVKIVKELYCCSATGKVNVTSQ